MYSIGALCYRSAAMLQCLRVSHFAIIDQLELELAPGLNVVTGETGAGKSIMVSALQLVLGGRARPEVVRTGADAAEVEAQFLIAPESPVQRHLADMGLEGQDELVLRRVITRSGRSRAYVNGRMASAAQLTALASGLVDISSQHEHHSLVDAGSHMRYLDAFGGLHSLRKDMGQAYRTLHEHTHRMANLETESRERLEREDLLRFQVQEITSLALQPDEEQGLVEERDRNRNAERLAQLTGGAEQGLYSDDDAICPLLARIVHMVEEAATMDSQLGTVTEQLVTAQAQLEDAARELGSYAQSIQMDPQRLAEIDDRLHAISRLRRKYGGGIEEILAHCERAQDELAQLDQSESRLEDLKAQLEAATTAATALAQTLSERRHACGNQLGQQITAELASLSMGDAEVRVEVDHLKTQGNHQAESLVLDNARLTAQGIDRVEFLIATNRGEKPQPLQKIASGGELSRAMLAIKRVLADVGPGGLYVFDEVDSGVGGAVAEVIGRKIKEVSRHHQVLCITHLPQIAVFADVHFHVRKGVFEGRTRSHIDRLSKRERHTEIARMLGGIKITESTRAAAREMLLAAQNQG